MSVISNTERALSIAQEHVAWAQEQGMRPEQVLNTLGWRRKPLERAKTWPEVVDALVAAWSVLQ